jgi:hypothetical protein
VSDPDRLQNSVEVPLRSPAPITGRLARQASLGSALAAVVLVVVAVMATSIREPVPSEPPAGAVGGTLPPVPTEPLDSWIPIGPTPGPTETGGASADPMSPPLPSSRATPWRTSPPSDCDPYVKPCDPTVPPTYPYVSVLITTNGNTDATIGIGKVTVAAAGRTFTCTTYTSRCFYEVPPGTPVVATAYRQTGSVCTDFHLIWEDHSTVVSEGCGPIQFTTKTQEALLVANFDQVPSPPPATQTAPPATPEATPTPEVTPEDTPAPG